MLSSINARQSIDEIKEIVQYNKSDQINKTEIDKTVNPYVNTVNMHFNTIILDKYKQLAMLLL
ncbi:hypothetical protein KFK09_024954 [Dendrobium nobile]|uniref:Uncharacterized protein n=1 Tax=Dendrobium nobile TaxID=94219 RepID=A0A8T3AFI1_DENNO|nr:hypothetical protein KFK09_024954 [Dendrobium nobile]